MTIAEAVVSDVSMKALRPRTTHLLKEVITNKHYLALLRFFVTQPSGSFTRSAVIQALADKYDQIELDESLAMLVTDGAVDTNMQNGDYYYLLTREEPVRHLVINLAEFNWQQFQRIKKYYIGERQLSA